MSPINVGVAFLSEFAGERSNGRENACEKKRAYVETRPSGEAVRQRRAGERSGARKDVVREVVEELRVRVRDPGVLKHGGEEVGDELPKGGSIALVAFNLTELRGETHTPLPAS